MPEQEADKEAAKLKYIGSRDKEFAELKYVQNLESMRHVQRLEATEMGFVLTLYVIFIAGLLNLAGKDGTPFSRLWAVLLPPCVAVLLVAPVLTYHFWKRRQSFYEHRCRLNQALQLLGERYSTKKQWAGFGMRIVVIWVLTLTVISLAIFVVA